MNKKQKLFKSNGFLKGTTFIGRRYGYQDVWSFEPKGDLSLHEITEFLRLTYAFEDGKCFGKKPTKEMAKHFRLASKEEYDAIYNPEMEIDQDA